MRNSGFLLFVLLLLVSCFSREERLKEEVAGLEAELEEQHQKQDSIEKEIIALAIQDSSKLDTIEFTESFKQEDIPANEYLEDRLKPIRANFKRINSIERWNEIVEMPVWESVEGGHAKYYYNKGVLERIVVRYFGENSQSINEFYFADNQFSFVFERLYKYNRPFYWDSKKMKENNDDQIWDFNLSEIEETRSYFENNDLIHQINNQDCGSPFTQEYLKDERKRLIKEVKMLMDYRNGVKK